MWRRHASYLRYLVNGSASMSVPGMWMINNVPYDWGDVEYYQDAAAAMYEDCPDNEPWGD